MGTCPKAPGDKYRCKLLSGQDKSDSRIVLPIVVSFKLYSKFFLFPTDISSQEIFCPKLGSIALYRKLVSAKGNEYILRRHGGQALGVYEFVHCKHYPANSPPVPSPSTTQNSKRLTRPKIRSGVPGRYATTK